MSENLSLPDAIARVQLLAESLEAGQLAHPLAAALAEPLKQAILQVCAAAARAEQLGAERDKARAAAEDWQLAADGIKHHFGCCNNVVTGDPNGHECDRCRAEAAEAHAAQLQQVLMAVHRLPFQTSPVCVFDGKPVLPQGPYVLADDLIAALAGTPAPPASRRIVNSFGLTADGEDTVTAPAEASAAEEPRCTGPFSSAYDCPVHDPRKRAKPPEQE